MAEPWFFDVTGRLYFIYRAKKWEPLPATYMTTDDIASVAVDAVDVNGNDITVAQQPTYSAAHKGFLGYIDSGDLVNQRFVTISLTPTLTLGAVAEWAPPKTFDVVIDVEDGENISLET